jgi:hypothetical protein
MAKSDKTETLSLEEQLETANREIADLKSTVTVEKTRADEAEFALRELQDKVAATDPDAQHVEVQKGSEIKRIHPATVESHRQAGWKRV